MVMTADQHLKPAADRRTGDGLALARIDRAREFRRAARRTAVVKVLRIALPVMTLVLLGAYALTIAQTAGVARPDALAALALRKVLPADLVMRNPRYEGYSEDGGKYNFTAKTARQHPKSADVIVLNGIVGEVYQADNTRTDVTATRGDYNNKRSVLVLAGEINVDSQSGLKARLTQAVLQTKTGVLTSSKPVLVEFPNGSVRAEQLDLRQKQREATFKGHVVTELTPPPEEATKPAEPAGETSATQAMFTPSNGPIVIDSATLDLNDGSKTAVFTGNVRARQGDDTMTTPKLEVTYEGEGLMSSATVATSATGSAAPAGKVRRIVATKPVVMKRANGDVVTSDSADFDAPSQSAVLTGEVIMTSGTDRRAVSERVELNEATGAIVLLGDVVITQGGNELTGGRLAIDRKSGTAQLTRPPEGSYGPGRISARLVRDAQGQGPGKAKTKTDEAGDPGLLSFRTNPSAPVEVHADALDVNDQRKVAVFRGDVDASQDGFKIHCAELSAFYKGAAGLVDVANPGAGPAGDGAKPSSELTRIEARKQVRVIAKDGRTATGDWADFDVKANKITMGGNVVLAQGKNMVRGTRLLIDLTTGESKIDTAPQNTVASPGGGGWVTRPGAAASEGKGRASAVFFPQEMKDENDHGGSDKAKPARPDAADGWSATSKPD